MCGLYLNPPENALVWSVDEKTGIQAKSRVNPTRPPVPASGRRGRHHGHPGPAGVRGPPQRHGEALCRPRRTRGRRRRLGHRLDLRRELRRLPPRPGGPDPKGSCTASSTTSLPSGRPPSRSPSTSTATCSSTAPRPIQLAQPVELWFSIMERRLLRSGEFHSVDELADRVVVFIKDYNRRAPRRSGGPTTVR